MRSRTSAVDRCWPKRSSTRSRASPAVRAERQATDGSRVTGQAEDRLAAVGVPELDQLAPGCGQAAAVRAEGHVPDRTRLHAHGPEFLPGLDIPDAHGPVRAAGGFATGGGQAAAVGAERQG